MAKVFGDRDSNLVIVGNSTMQNFTGNARDASYQVIARPGLIINMFNK